MELISIIIPVYNVEKYLRQCIDSLLNQTYKSTELIIVDDGSTDTSGTICDEYKQYSNCIVIHKENAGLGMARNTGLEYAKGSYVTFFDSDDWAEPDLIENLYHGMEDNNVQMCKGGLKRVKDNGDVVKYIRFDDEVFPKSDVAKKMLPRMIGSSPDKKDSLEMCVCGSLYNMKIITDHQIAFPSERVLISEDLIFNIEYMQYSNGGCSISYCGYNYRMNDNSITRSYRPHKFEQCKKYYLYVKNRLEELGYDQETIFRLDRIMFVYIRGCIGQESSKRSSLNKKERKQRIGEICSDELIQAIIREYPINRLKIDQIKQKIFLYLVKFRWSNILALLSELGRI